MRHQPDRRLFLSTLGASPLLASPTWGKRIALAAPPQDPPRPVDRMQADLGANYPFLAQIADSWEPTLFPKNAAVKFDQAFRDDARRRVLQVMSYDPPRVDLQPQVVERTEREDHVRERVEFSTTPWFRIAAYVLVPKNLKGRAPAIVDLHSHGGMFLFGKEKVIDLGDNHPAMVRYHEQNYDRRPTATELVRRGYVVISIDAFMFGERRLLMDEDLAAGWDRSQYSLDTVQQLNAKCRAKESTLAKSLVVAGATWPGIVNYDDRRTIDYLLTRSDVDADRIGCIGISMGGYRSAYLAALDPRIRAACVVGFMSSMRPMLRAHIDTHSWVHFLPGLHRLMDFPELAALAAPRALFVQQCQQDRLFTLEGMKQSVERIASLYRSADASAQFHTKFYDEPHRWTVAMQDEAFAWLEQKLRMS